MESIIRLACIAHDIDYWKVGRTVERLGLDHLKPAEIHALVEGRRELYLPLEPQIPVAA
jgi:opine dehydrogenase